MVSRKSQLGWVRCHCLISVISGPKFTEILSPNVGRVAVENVLVRFRIYSSVPETFDAKV